MNHDETRDELARMDGWVKQHIGWWTTDGLKSSYNHPHAPTLDGANAAVPEGWTWGRGLGLPVVGASKMRWVAWRWTPYQDVEVPDTGNPMADLYALALACRHAMEERK